MPVKIRLQRHGKKGKPFYWIVAADARSKRDGRSLEKLGTYNPNVNPAAVELDVDKAVEAGKKQFVGTELPGKTLGVIGLGAVGVAVANAALDLGMTVIGFDPKMTVRNAWQLSAGVKHAESLDQLFQNADAVTCHVPLIEATKGMVKGDSLALMKNGATLVNFARGAVVDNDAVLAALDSGKLHAYICDFPTPELIAHPKVVALPHLGASTGEAEENCAIMVAE